MWYSVSRGVRQTVRCKSSICLYLRHAAGALFDNITGSNPIHHLSKVAYLLPVFVQNSALCCQCSIRHRPSDPAWLWTHCIKTFSLFLSSPGQLLCCPGVVMLNLTWNHFQIMFVKVCQLLHDPVTRMHEIGISVFSPFTPMLGDRAAPDKVIKWTLHESVLPCLCVCMCACIYVCV